MERSTQTRPTPRFSTERLARKLLARESRTSSSVIVPGVTTRTIPRSTIPLVVFGSLICSQMATLKPFCTSFIR